MQYDDVISNAIWGRHIENRLLAISLRFIVRLTQNLIGRSRIIIRRRPLDQHSNFQKFMMADGRLLKMVLSLYLSGESSDFNEIWCADANFSSKVSKFCRFKVDIFVYISAIYYPINVKFGMKKQNHTDMACHMSKIPIFCL